MELLAIKTEINALKAMITTAIEQFKMAITSFNATPQSLPSNTMDTKIKASTENHHQHQAAPNQSCSIYSRSQI